MSQRLQVPLEEEELREIQSAARAKRQTVAEWERYALLAARREKPAAPADRKLAAVRAASRHAFPTADVNRMIAEIESGYGSGSEH